MPIAGAAVGSFVGMLVAGVLHKVFPEHDLTFLLAGVVAAGCLIGAVLEWHSDFGHKEE